MECLPEDPIFKFRDDTLQEVRKQYDLDKPGAMKEAIDILEEWVKAQNHFLKKNFKRHYLERTIISTKGSVERAKARLDKGCTLRTLTPYLFEDCNMKEDFKHYFYTNYTQALLPQLTEDNYRVHFIKNCGKNYDSQAFIDFYRNYVIFAEYMRAHDYATGCVYVLDYTELSLMTFMTSMNLIDLRQALTVFMDGYGVRIKGIHIITPSKLIDGLVSLFKQVLSSKIGERIYVHNNLESLYECIPKDILPKDYGGKEKTLRELHDDWVDVLSSEENRQYQREMNAARTDENFRQRDTFNDQYMGMPGTFRTLSVD